MYAFSSLKFSSIFIFLIEVLVIKTVLNITIKTIPVVIKIVKRKIL